ncbi:MAG: reverse transcriptase domain-containing protein [archaeon]|nr:reverse transcriptase domain-containing protein [archaeon]
MDKSVSELQQSLCRVAKADKARRFHSLYDKLYREDVLREAWRHVRANNGTAGIDGIEIEDVEKQEGGEQAFLGQIAKELKEHTYKPSPAKRVWIPKANGKMRPLSIPTLKDRTVQAAAMLVLQPIFEQDFESNSYGFREGRSTLDAVREVTRWLNFGYESVIDADISSCFDTIPKSLLMKQFARRVVDGSILSLVKQWLNAGILDGGVKVDSGERGVAN